MQGCQPTLILIGRASSLYHDAAQQASMFLLMMSMRWTVWFVHPPSFL